MTTRKPGLALVLNREEDLVLLDQLEPVVLPDPSQATAVLGEDGEVSNRLFDYLRRHELTPDRIYFGNEFCERLLPGPDALSAVIDHAARRNLRFTLLTPVLTLNGFEKAMSLVHTVAERFPEGAEVVVNSFGLLARMRRDHPHLEPVLGRLMNKQKRMPRFKRRALAVSLTQHQIEALAGTPYSNPLYARFLAERGVKRVEFDAVLQGTRLSDVPLSASLYIPWAAVTMTRFCETGSLSLPPGEKFDLPSRCRQECRRMQVIRMSERSAPLQFCRGNTVFLEAELDDPDRWSEKGFDRLVVEPRLPM